VASVIEYKANDLTKFVINYLTLHGHFASRIQSQGQYHPKHSRWVKSKVRKGIGDIIACIHGKFVMIEIKAGKDRQSEYQKQVEKDVNDSGGYYWIIRQPDDFLTNLSRLQAGYSHSHAQPDGDNQKPVRKPKKHA
jgi:hypothetical protein